MAFPWRDSVTGDVFDLPRTPTSREDLERMLTEARAIKEASVQPVDPVTAMRLKIEDTGEKGLKVAAEGALEGIDWLVNSPALKSVADAIRSPGGRETLRATVPGFEAMEAIPGLISAGGAAVGANWDPIKERLASQEKAPLPDVPELDEIIQREALEGLPTAIEQVAPIDIATLGLSGAARGALTVPKLARTAAPLAKAADAAQIFEGLVGTGQVAHGVATGDLPEAGVGALRMVGGVGAALPSRARDLDLGATIRQGLEDVAPFVDETARGMGFTDLPVPVSRMVDEPSGKKAGLPPVPEGHTRYFRGGKEGDFYTRREDRAGSYDTEGSYVDVPSELHEGFYKEAQKLGQPTPDDVVLPPEWTGKAQPHKFADQTIEVKEDEIGDVDDLFASLGVKRVEPGKATGPEASAEGPSSIAAKTNEELDAEWQSLFNESRRRGRSEDGMTPEEQFDLEERMTEIEAEQARRKEVTPASNQAEVDAAHERMLAEELSNQPPPLPPGAAPTRVVEGAPPVVTKPTPPPLPEGVAPPRPTSGAPPLPKGESLSKILDEGLAASEAKVPPKLPEGAAPIKSTLREVPPIQKKGQSFSEYMTEKFGDKPTSSKERAIARAEWNKAREERKLLRLAEDAGIPPEKLRATMEGAPKEGGPEAGKLSAWARFSKPVIENFETVHPWLKKVFTKFVDEAEAPAMKFIAESHRIKEGLSKLEARHVIDILDGKKGIDAQTPANVRQAAISYRHMLDQVWSDAIASGVRKAKDRKRQTYFPHKFAEGWDDNLVQNIYLDKNWNLRDSSLERARVSKRADYRRDLDVLDEYFLSAYRRVSEVSNFGKRLEVLRRFAKKHVTDKKTAEWLQTNIRRIMGREHPTGFDRFAGHARHVQALTDLGLAAFYQPIQATNTALYGGLGRSLRALKVIVDRAPDEVYDAIRSRALVPDITQELVAGAYGAREGIPSRALQKFMWGIPTVDKWTRIHANTVGKLMVGDALKGSTSALKDLKALGFDVDDLAALKKAADEDPDFSLKVGRTLSDKALFRSGAMELPGWVSSTSGKLATQYMRFMYRHTLFVRDIFKQAAEGNVRPLARFLTVAPVLVNGMAEVLYPVREGMREVLRQGIEGEGDIEKVSSEAFGDENVWDDEIQWEHVLRSKRIPWSHPLKRILQNTSMWGGIGVFQIAIERMSGASGSPIEVGAKFTGPVPGNAMEAAGSIVKDVGTLGEDLEWDIPPGKHTRTWAARQIPMVGYPIARRMRDELGE